MLGELAKAAQQADGELKRQLAELEVKTIAALGDRAAQLSAADRKQLDRLHALALAETGEHVQAIKLLEGLAQRYPKDGGLQEDLAGLWSQSNAPDEFAQSHRQVERGGSKKPRRHAALVPRQSGPWPKPNWRSASGRKPERSSNWSRPRIPILAARRCGSNSSGCWRSARSNWPRRLAYSIFR